MAKELLLTRKIRSYDESIEKHPNDGKWHYAKAETLMELAKETQNYPYYYEQALTSYTIAIELSPQNPMYFLNRSKLHVELKRYDLAALDVVKAKLAPSTGNDFLDMYSSDIVEDLLKLPAIKSELKKLVTDGNISSAELKDLFPNLVLESTEIGSRASDFDSKAGEQEYKPQGHQPITHTSTQNQLKAKLNIIAKLEQLAAACIEYKPVNYTPTPDQLEAELDTLTLKVEQQAACMMKPGLKPDNHASMMNQLKVESDILNLKVKLKLEQQAAVKMMQSVVKTIQECQNELQQQPAAPEQRGIIVETLEQSKSNEDEAVTINISGHEGEWENE